MSNIEMTTDKKKANLLYLTFYQALRWFSWFYIQFDKLNLILRRIDNSKESKSLKEDNKGAMYIKDSAEIEVKSTEEALELVARAQKKRVVAYTELNSESSRSHSIFTIRIVQAPFDPTTDDFNPKVGRETLLFDRIHFN